MHLYEAFSEVATAALESEWTASEVGYFIDLYRVFFDIHSPIPQEKKQALTAVIVSCQERRDHKIPLTGAAVRRGLKKLECFSFQIADQPTKQYSLPRKYFTSLYGADDRVVWAPGLFRFAYTGFFLGYMVKSMLGIAKAASEYLVLEEIDSYRIEEHFYDALYQAVSRVLEEGWHTDSLLQDQCSLFIRLVEKLLHSSEIEPSVDCGIEFQLRWAVDFLAKRKEEVCRRAVNRGAIREVLEQLERVRCCLHQTSFVEENMVSPLNRAYFEGLFVLDPARAWGVPLVYRFVDKDKGEEIMAGQVQLFIILLDGIAQKARALFNLFIIEEPPPEMRRLVV